MEENPLSSFEHLKNAELFFSYVAKYFNKTQSMPIKVTLVEYKNRHKEDKSVCSRAGRLLHEMSMLMSRQKKNKLSAVFAAASSWMLCREMKSAKIICLRAAARRVFRAP
jgi:hypothetical protein